MWMVRYRQLKLDMSLNKLRWKSRKGIRELDILLQNFLNQEYEQLNEYHKKIFEEVLEKEVIKGNNFIFSSGCQSHHFGARLHGTTNTPKKKQQQQKRKSAHVHGGFVKISTIKLSHGLKFQDLSQELQL